MGTFSEARDIGFDLIRGVAIVSDDFILTSSAFLILSSVTLLQMLSLALTTSRF